MNHLVEPPETKPGFLDEPQAGVCRVMGLNKALLVENGLVEGCGDGLCRAGDVADHAALDKAGAEAGAVLVAGADDDLGVRGQVQALSDIGL